MKLFIQLRSTQHELDLPESSKVEDLQEQIQTLGILKRNQKLIYKGKMLLAHHTLEQAKVESAKEEARREEAANLRRRHNEQKVAKEQEKQARREAQASAGTMSSRSLIWAKTGIVGLRDSQLTAIPDELIAVAGTAQAVDLTNNRLSSLREGFEKLTHLQKLSLSRNQITDLAVHLTPAFQKLQILVLSHNRLTAIPAVCMQPSLIKLDLADNQLTSLPSTVEAMCSLRSFSLAHNAISELPAGLGHCSALVELDLSHNHLSALPEELRKLQLLQNLQLSHNRLDKLPGAILRECQALHTINVHANPVTIEQLRDSSDFQIFDQRRRAKYDKQMDLRVMTSTEGFDEGADHVEHNHWKSTK